MASFTKWKLGAVALLIGNMGGGKIWAQTPEPSPMRSLAPSDAPVVTYSEKEFASDLLRKVFPKSCQEACLVSPFSAWLQLHTFHPEWFFPRATKSTVALWKTEALKVLEKIKGSGYTVTKLRMGLYGGTPELKDGFTSLSRQIPLDWLPSGDALGAWLNSDGIIPVNREAVLKASGDKAPLLFSSLAVSAEWGVPIFPGSVKPLGKHPNMAPQFAGSWMWGIARLKVADTPEYEAVMIPFRPALSNPTSNLVLTVIRPKKNEDLDGLVAGWNALSWKTLARSLRMQSVLFALPEFRMLSANELTSLYQDPEPQSAPANALQGVYQIVRFGLDTKGMLYTGIHIPKPEKSETPVERYFSAGQGFLFHVSDASTGILLLSGVRR